MERRKQDLCEGDSYVIQAELEGIEDSERTAMALLAISKFLGVIALILYMQAKETE